jgi:hypothetical protein
MTGKPIHASIRRLYSAAAQVGDDAPAKVARTLNISPQTLNNWEARGISRVGSLTAQDVYGCDAVWLTTGKGRVDSAAQSQSHSLQLDPDTLAETARTLRERFDDAAMVYDLIENQPQIFIEAYELYANRTTDERTPEIDRALAMKVADLTPQGAKKDERGTQVPTKGTPERKVGTGRKR